MAAARKQMAGLRDEGGAQGRPISASGSGGKLENVASASAEAGSARERRPLSNYNFDEAVLKVQEWNEALKCESALCHAE